MAKPDMTPGARGSFLHLPSLVSSQFSIYFEKLAVLDEMAAKAEEETLQGAVVVDFEAVQTSELGVDA